MQIDHKKFFDGFKDHFDSSLEPDQIKGIDFLLDSFSADPLWKDPRHIAYALATVYHETAGSMQPVEEGYYLGRYGQARVKSFQKSLRYYPYFGRGYVQLTWKTGYQRASKEFGIDLVNQPELALDKETAYHVMTLGMFQGWFAGDKIGRHTLKRYIHGAECDYKEARRIINGTDKASLIEGYAKSFEKILKVSADAPAALRDAQPIETPADDGLQPDPPEVEQPPTDLTQNADMIVNAAPSDQPAITAAAASEPHEVEERKVTGILGKASAFVTALLTGTVIMPDWITNGLTADTFKLVFNAIYGFRYAIAALVIVVFVMRKYESIEMRKKQMDINADPKLGNVVFKPDVKPWWRFW